MFSWVEWPYKTTRDASIAVFMEDPRIAAASDMPFNGQRVIFGSFASVVRLMNFSAMSITMLSYQMTGTNPCSQLRKLAASVDLVAPQRASMSRTPKRNL